MEIERQKYEIELLKYENEPVVIEDEKKNQEIAALKRDLEAKNLEIALLKQQQETVRMNAAASSQVEPNCVQGIVSQQLESVKGEAALWKENCQLMIRRAMKAESEAGNVKTENANLRQSLRPGPGVQEHMCCVLSLRADDDAELVKKLEEANAKLQSRSRKNAAQKRCIDQLKVRCQEYAMQERKMSKLQEESVGLEKQIEQLTEAHQELLRTFGKAKEDLIAAQQQVASLTSHIQDQQVTLN